MPFGQWIGDTVNTIKEKAQGIMGLSSRQPIERMEPIENPLAQYQPMETMQKQSLGAQNIEQLLTRLIMNHEGLEPLQTPFRITSPKMKKWTSMFDDSIKIELDPRAKKGKGRENFLYLKRQEDLLPAIEEQFRRYANNPSKYGLPDNVTVAEAVQKFDQTGAANKIQFLEENEIDTSQPLINLFGES